MPGIAGRHSRIRVAGAPVFAAFSIAADTGDHKTYQFTNALHHVLDPFAVINMSVGGVAIYPPAAQLNRLNGTITFPTADAGRGTVAADVYYLPLVSAARCDKYNWNVNANAVDDTDFDTAFSDNGFQRKQTTAHDISGSIGGKWYVDSQFRTNILNSDLIILEFFPDRSGARSCICRARLSKYALASAMDSIITQDVEFVGAGDAEANVASR